jgi:imidazolonepropionase-like amidohydrolase
VDTAGLSDWAVVRRVGIPILAGSDLVGPMPGGLALHAELAGMVILGLSPLEALRAATLNPAKLLGSTDSLGTVAPGKLADLVLLDADPLADITNTTTIRAVVANGHYYDRARLDSLVAD